MFKFWKRKNTLEEKINKAFDMGDFVSLLRIDTADGISQEEYVKLFYGWVFAAGTTIAGDIAKLDRGIFNDKDERIKTPIDDLLDYSFVYSVVLHYVIFGVSHIWVVRGATGKIIDLVILRPDRFSFVFDEEGNKTNKIQYILDDGKTLILEERDIITIRNIDPERVNNKYVGKSIIGAAVYSILTDIEASKWNYKFFKNGTWVGLVLESENILSEKVLERIKRRLEQEYNGTANSNKMMILDAGMKLSKLANTQKDVDFTEGKKLTRDEILAIMKVPKQILGLGEGNNLNVRYFEKIYAERTLLPIVRQIENTFNKYLLKGTGTLKFLNVLPLDREELRKDFESGLITINEYRERIGYARLKEGDVLVINGQFINVSKEGQKQAKPEIKNFEEFKNKFKDKIQKVAKEVGKKVNKGNKLEDYNNKEYWDKYFEGVFKRLDKYEASFEKTLRGIWNRQQEQIIKEVKMMLKAGKGGKIKFLDSENSFLLWLVKMLPLVEKILGNEYKKMVELVAPDNQDQIFGNIDNWLKDTARELLQKMAGQIDKTTNKKITKIVFDGIMNNKSEGQIIEEIQQQFKQWKDTPNGRLSEIVRTETTRLQQEANIKAFKDLGITKKRWYTVKDERRCPFCASMDGKTIYIDEAFVNKGEILEADGKRLIVDYEDIKRPPLHPRCRCQLLPVI